MSLAVVMSRSLDGCDAPPVRVEVHLANGLPSFTLVGLAETEVKESRERVRAALAESGFDFPHNKRVTVNLAPADLPKESGRFDLPIALGILAAAGVVDVRRLDSLECAGELSLAGELRPIRGAVSLALALRRAGNPGRCLLLPEGSAQLAARVPDVDVRVARTLSDVVLALQAPAQDTSGEAPLDLPRAQAMPSRPDRAAAPDLADVRGQVGARRALEIAAAGGHSLLMIGPPGSGKSMLAQRLSGLLPPMAEDDALASAALQSLTNSRWAGEGLGQRPYRAPHHSASAVALVGGGSPPRPGEISLAHGGVLFLDELPEFPRNALEALREPLETGHVTISRAGRQAHFPARFQLVAAMNPCPCGWLGAQQSTGRTCRCTPQAVDRYRARLSGPLLDRVDLLVEVPAQSSAELLTAAPGETSAIVAERVDEARAWQQARQGTCNAQLDASRLHDAAHIDDAALRFLQAAADRLGWSGRAIHRVLKVARTIADLAASPRMGVAHIAEAVQYRRANSL
jgi:magnesium chelatase family protein